MAPDPSDEEASKELNMRITRYGFLSIFLLLTIGADSPHVHYYYKDAKRSERCPNSEKMGRVFCCACDECRAQCD